MGTVIRVKPEWGPDKDIELVGNVVWFKCHCCGERVGQYWDDFESIQDSPNPEGLYCFTCFLQLGKRKVKRIRLR